MLTRELAWILANCEVIGSVTRNKRKLSEMSVLMIPLPICLFKKELVRIGFVETTDPPTHRPITTYLPTTYPATHRQAFIKLEEFC